MRDKVVAKADDAVADARDGAVIMFGGFISAAYPCNLIRALGPLGVRDITGIATNIAPGR